MILKSLRINQLSPEAMDWYTRYLAAFEAMDADAFFAFLAEDAVVQVNDRLPYYGHAGARASLERYFRAFDRVVHEPLNIYGADNEFGVEMLTHFTPTGRAAPIVVPSTSFYTRGAAGLLISIRHQVADAALSA